MRAACRVALRSRWRHAMQQRQDSQRHTFLPDRCCRRRHASCRVARSSVAGQRGRWRRGGRREALIGRAYVAWRRACDGIVRGRAVTGAEICACAALARARKAGSLKGKTLFITGASRGESHSPPTACFSLASLQPLTEDARVQESASPLRCAQLATAQTSWWWPRPRCRTSDSRVRSIRPRRRLRKPAAERWPSPRTFALRSRSRCAAP